MKDRLITCDIVDDDGCVGVSDVTRDETLESLLSCGVPKLQSKLLVV